MRKVYYSLMRNLASFFVMAIVAAFAAPQQQSLRTASLETHEGLTVSARPWTDAALYKEKFPKKSPFAAGVLAVQVTFKNDSEDTLKVSLDRVRLSLRLEEDNRQELASLTPAQFADAVLKPGGKDPSASRKIPLPVPLPKGGGDKHWAELQQQAEQAGFPTSVIGPKSSVQGLLYFDLRGQFDLLNSAHLYIPDVAVMGKEKTLTYFEIDLSRAGAQ